MMLYITPTRLISEVQSEFNHAFPFLKLEFFQNKFRLQSNIKQEIKMSPASRIGDCQSFISEGEIEITKKMKGRELEQKLKDQFGLIAQIFRRSGNLWLQTTMTDSWTLEKQNEHGMELSQIHPKFKTPGGDNDSQAFG
jgi:hypothetical protein